MLGQAPPGPATLRARIGGAFIGGMSKMLWWYTHSIRSCFDAIAQKTDAQTALLRTVLNRQAAIDGRLTVIESDVSADERFATLREEVAGLDGTMHEFRQSIEEIRPDHRNNAAVDQALAKFEARLSEFAVYEQRTREELNLQSRRVSILLEELRRHTPGKNELPPAVEADIETSRDAQYLAFENIFRGSRQDIKNIQSDYVPYLKEHGLGTPTMPVVDIGCGRGEWLEVLRDNGLTGQGVDSNTSMLERCREIGLPVVHSDGLAFLRSAPDSSIGAITAFHVVEHIPFEKLLAFVDAALRVLRPGGCLIMETPNPENVLVGSYTFYNDPTHLRPIPSGLLRFIVEWRGFVDVELRNLHPYAEAMRFPASSGIVGERLNHLLYGPQDYAVLACKP
jgi:O-antigen chain-terminating methyltransferase